MSTNQKVSQSKWVVTLSDLQEKQNYMKDMKYEKHIFLQDFYHVKPTRNKKLSLT